MPRLRGYTRLQPETGNRFGYRCQKKRSSCQVPAGPLDQSPKIGTELDAIRLVRFEAAQANRQFSQCLGSGDIQGSSRKQEIDLGIDVKKNGPHARFLRVRSIKARRSELNSTRYASSVSRLRKPTGNLANASAPGIYKAPAGNRKSIWVSMSKKTVLMPGSCGSA